MSILNGSSSTGITQLCGVKQRLFCPRSLPFPHHPPATKVFSPCFFPPARSPSCSWGNTRATVFTSPSWCHAPAEGDALWSNTQPGEFPNQAWELFGQTRGRRVDKYRNVVQEQAASGHPLKAGAPACAWCSGVFLFGPPPCVTG